MSTPPNTKLTYTDNIGIGTATIYNLHGALLNLNEDIVAATNSKFKGPTIDILENLQIVIEDAITSMHNLNNLSVKEIGELLKQDNLSYELYD